MSLPLPIPPVALLLDFDGVILQSVEIKIQAFLTIYKDEHPAKLNEVLAYQHLHGGVTRRVKFRHFETQLFGRSGDAASVERLATAYAALVHGAVLACPFVPGAQDFLRAAHGRADMHIVSGTPQDELVDIVRRRGLADCFESVVGAPTTKPEAFAQILRGNAYAAERSLAVGDSTTEYDAAADLGIPFLGVVPAGAHNPFRASVPTVPTLEAIDALLGLT